MFIYSLIYIHIWIFKYIHIFTYLCSNMWNIYILIHIFKILSHLYSQKVWKIERWSRCWMPLPPPWIDSRNGLTFPRGKVGSCWISWAAQSVFPLVMIFTSLRLFTTMSRIWIFMISWVFLKPSQNPLGYSKPSTTKTCPFMPLEDILIWTISRHSWIISSNTKVSKM